MRAVTQPWARALGPVTTVVNAAARIVTVKRNRIKSGLRLWFERQILAGDARFLAASRGEVATFGADCRVGVVNCGECVARGRFRMKPQDRTQQGAPHKGTEARNSSSPFENRRGRLTAADLGGQFSSGGRAFGLRGLRGVRASPHPETLRTNTTRPASPVRVRALRAAETESRFSGRETHRRFPA